MVPARPAALSAVDLPTPSQDLQAAPSEWDSFVITHGGKSSGIRLVQSGPCSFSLDCDIRFNGDLGLAHLKLDRDAEERLRTVSASTLRTTDLASVPAVFRWWSNTYGLHSPAALIHDRFIGQPAESDPGRPAGVTEAHVDRYFRFMLSASDVPFLRRWLMWAAVAARTRFISSLVGKVSLILWFVVVAAALYAAARLGLDGRWLLAGIGLVVPAPAALFWGRQMGAGLILAYVGMPVLLPPSSLMVPFLLLYVVAEAIGQQLGRSYRYLSTHAERIEPIQ